MKNLNMRAVHEQKSLDHVTPVSFRVNLIFGQLRKETSFEKLVTCILLTINELLVSNKPHFIYKLKFIRINQNQS